MATEIFGKVTAIETKKKIASQVRKVTGFKYPLKKSVGGGYFSKETGTALVRSNLRQLLLTDKGERVMLPTFGTTVRENLFQPLDQETFFDIRQSILESINNFIRGVEILKLRVLPGEDVSVAGAQSLMITLTVRIKELDNIIIEVPVKIG